MLTVFNCGQGDALKLESEFCCFDSNKPLYIDLGPASHNHNNNPGPIDLLITHSHEDHVRGGFNNNITVDTLYIPAYFPEIYKIIKKLSTNQTNFLPNSFRHVELLYENSNFGGCNHAEVLNPPLNPKEIFKKKDVNNVELEQVSSFLENYNTNIAEIINQETPFDSVEYPDGYNSEEFIIFSINIIRILTRNGNVDIDKAIKRFIEYDANKISVVFKYFQEDDGLTYLLTGDADCSVFNRLLKKETCLKSDVLKVPHHGSKYNLKIRILSKIAPSIAIISHGNGVFGKAKDPHPNSEVIRILKAKNITTYYTNDVKKNGGIIENAYSGLINNANAFIL